MQVLPVDPKSQMVTYTLDNGSLVTIRASGTEPKLKYYIEFKTPPGLSPEEALAACADVEKLEKAVIEDLIRAEHHGLVAKK